MKKKVIRVCNVEVVGDKKYKSFVNEAVKKFLEYIDCYFNAGYIKGINLDVSFMEKKENE